MISKERLLAGLYELAYVEEGMVTLNANFAKTLVDHTEGMEGGKANEMKKILSVLHRDSSRHKEMLDEMVEQVTASVINEY